MIDVSADSCDPCGPPPCANVCTATWEPLFKTETPGPTIDYSCPSGTPFGLGTVTPDIGWSMNCSNCLLTLTPQTTMTPPATQPWQASQTAQYFQTQTATASATATITPSPTNGSATPTTAPGFYMVNIPGSCSVTHPNYDVWVSCIASITLPNVGTDTLRALVFTATGGAANCQFKRAYVAAPNVWDNTSDHLENNNGNICVNKYQNSGGCAAFGFTEFGYTGWKTSEFTPPGNFNASYQLGWGKAGCNGVSASTGNYRAIYYGTNPPITATPTVTPTPGPGYCAVVSGTSGTNPWDILPGITLGATTCLEVPAFTWELDTINWLTGWSLEDVSFPGVKLCLREISFGVINLFNQTFDLDILAFAMMAILVIRIIMRS